MKNKKTSFWKVARKTGKVLYGFVFAVLVLIAGVIAISAFKIPGNYKLLAVQSGSMEPKIKMGSVVVVKPQKEYQKGDIVTVSNPVNPKMSITHRIYDISEKEGRIFYITKGDANDVPDTEERLKENIIGKTIFSIPLLGYPVSFAKTRDGLIILVIIPATIIIWSELMNIKNETKRLIEDRRKRKLTLREKVEVEIGEEEIEAERWYKRVFRKFFGRKKKISKKKK